MVGVLVASGIGVNRNRRVLLTPRGTIL